MGDRNARADCGRNYESLPRPPILSLVPSPTSWAGASPTAAFPLSWFPPTATLGLWWVQFSFQALTVTERACELLRCQPKMHEIAEASSIAFSVFILSAAGLTEVRDWGEFCIQRSTCIPPVVQVLNRGLSLSFPFKTGVNVTNEMIANVITDVELEQVSKLCQLAVQIFINRIEALLKFLGSQTADWIVSRVVVYIGE